MIFARHPADLRARAAGAARRLARTSLSRRTSWFRTGGPAQVLFEPADEADLAIFLGLPGGRCRSSSSGSAPTCWSGTAAFPGVVVRLGKGFQGIALEDGARIRAGAGAADVKVARVAAEAGMAGLSSCAAFRAPSAGRCA